MRTQAQGALLLIMLVSFHLVTVAAQIDQIHRPNKSSHQVSSTSGNVEEASKAVKAITKLGEVTKAVATAADVVKDISGVLDAFEAAAPELAVLGLVLSFVSLFLPSSTDEIMDELDKVMDAISNLRADVDAQFQKAFAAVNQDTCYNRLAGYENRITEGYHAFQLYRQAAKSKAPGVGSAAQQFQNLCGRSLCESAAYGLVQAILAKGEFASSCNVLDIFYTGNVNTDYYIGNAKSLSQNSAHLLQLISTGIFLASSVATMQAAPSDKATAYMTTRDLFKEDVSQLKTRIMSYVTKCETNFKANLQTNVVRVMQRSGGSNSAVAHAISAMGSDVFGQYSISTMVWDPIGTYAKMAWSCTSCVSWTRWQSKYNVLVYWVSPSSRGVSPINNISTMRSYLDKWEGYNKGRSNAESGGAISLLKSMLAQWSQLRSGGCLILVRGNGLQGIFQNLGSITQAYNSDYTYVFWAVNYSYNIPTLLFDTAATHKLSKWSEAPVSFVQE